MGTWDRRPYLSPFKTLPPVFFNDGRSFDCGRGALTSAVVEQAIEDGGNVEDDNGDGGRCEDGAQFCVSSIDLRCSLVGGCIVLLAFESQLDALDEGFLCDCNSSFFLLFDDSTVDDCEVGAGPKKASSCSDQSALPLFEECFFRENMVYIFYSVFYDMHAVTCDM